MRTTKIAKAAPFNGAPKINLASVFGASPNKPFMLRIPATGQRPMSFSVRHLPEGLTLNENIITGSVPKEGDYEIVLTAENALGQTSKSVTLEIRPDHVQITPLLGFTSWNAYASAVTQQNICDIANALVKHGIAEYGYSYVNLDSGWQSPDYGGEFDAILPNPKFPDMKAMVDQVHSLGLKCGIYSTPMLTAWGCPDNYESIPGCTRGEPDIRFTLENGGIGVIHKEKNNARQWEAWGFDYLKYDWSPCDTVNAELMRQELIHTGRDFAFCVTITALRHYVSYWSRFCNSFRNNLDSNGNWDRLLKIFDTYLEYDDVMTRGHYFDLDMLDVGNSVFKNNEAFLNEDEMIVSYSMRAFLNSPIQLSADLTDISDFELDLYCNDEIIAVNQDTAFSLCTQVYQREEGQSHLFVFEKKLADGNVAYGFFNLGESEETLTAAFDGQSRIRDLWSKEDLPNADSLGLTMPRHTVRVFKCSAKIKEFN